MVKFEMGNMAEETEKELQSIEDEIARVPFTVRKMESERSSKSDRSLKHLSSSPRGLRSSPRGSFSSITNLMFGTEKREDLLNKCSFPECSLPENAEGESAAGTIRRLSRYRHQSSIVGDILTNAGRDSR